MEEQDDSAVKPEPSTLFDVSTSEPTVQTGAKRRLSDTDDEERLGKKRKKEVEMHNMRLKAITIQMQKEIRVKRPKLYMKFKDGALRMTRTPGRRLANTPNTVSLPDLIHSDYLCAAFIFSFFMGNDELFQYLPFKTSERPRPWVDIYVGRDIAMDGLGKEFAGLETKRPKSFEEFERVVKCAQKGYRKMYGENFHAFYPFMRNGCAHTKMMVLVYPDFLRVVITSANLMTLDVVLGDNTWFIQDFPRIPPPADDDETRPKYVETKFERQLKRHIEQLGCPEDFLTRYLKPGKFDFSGVKVYLVTSVPGSYSGSQGTEYGQLALRRIVRNKILRYYKDDKVPRMSFEVCTGSVGHLENEDVVKNFLESCAGNRQESIEGKPELKLVFPTLRDVQKSNVGLPAANNISSHIDWRTLPEKGAEYLSTVFHHYRSKDPGTLFHLKIYVALHADKPKRTPLYLYMGSANISSSAWGVVKPELRSGVIAKSLATERLERVANFECGVVIKGRDIVGMLETNRWRDIIPYRRPTDALQGG
ncbi:tyrosyl-DNA phosphodiesterase-domain-containing protein [Mycena alexandri]|uniref:Tyrosyl-DNA phosphodiesterase-domain-containing protein n=1 Tax=Mycena alexandri TaxID=1745969 RepID=A0AAD6SC60_9AGAR|nr:tyrosyl-DNA phosphodiesterase-domain-containing protein [Mycena alexandri]